MIKAVLKDGVIHPLDPLPADWREGQALDVEASPAQTQEEINRWWRQMNEESAAVSSESQGIINQTVAQHQREQKEKMRRRMGLA